ncbi:hypothetical protein G6F40_016153 [Rhizopus arrhizus]|nr:hypothetical protein G6F40_016153 [Rhizopus arrhizus]
MRMRASSRWNTFLLAPVLALATTACTDSTAPSEAGHAARTASATVIPATGVANSGMAATGNAPAAYQKYYTARNGQPLMADLEFLARSGDANARKEGRTPAQHGVVQGAMRRNARGRCERLPQSEALPGTGGESGKPCCTDRTGGAWPPPR